MNSLNAQLETLLPGGYSPEGSAMAEPMAWSALALHESGFDDAAGRATKWLSSQQRRDGMVPATTAGDSPGWTTSLAVLAWNRIAAARFAKQIDKGVAWLLATEGKTNPNHPYIGHDTMLVGWSWAENTHSWLEPTALATMALTSTGHGQHPRTAQAVELLIDRLLPGGGTNYGNTMVLGQKLLPHLQPSSIVLWALARHNMDDPRIERTIDYIESELNRPTGAASLAYAMLALTAWNRRPDNAETLLTEAAARSSTSRNPYKLALLSLATREEPLFDRG